MFELRVVFILTLHESINIALVYRVLWRYYWITVSITSFDVQLLFPSQIRVGNYVFAFKIWIGWNFLHRFYTCFLVFYVAPVKRVCNIFFVVLMQHIAVNPDIFLNETMLWEDGTSTRLLRINLRSFVGNYMCDENWSTRWSNFFCRQLGFGWVTPSYRF